MCACHQMPKEFEKNVVQGIVSKPTIMRRLSNGVPDVGVADRKTAYFC